MRLRCTSCQLVRINGVVCHETGCSVAWRDYKRECKNCGRSFKPKERNQVCCGVRCHREFWCL